MAFAGLFGSLRNARAQTPRAQRYVTVIMAEPSDDVIRQLAALGDGDDDHARWELRYARRALGLLIAERDALDDLTSSEVAAELEDAHERDTRIAPEKRAIAAQQFNARLHAYRDALKDRANTAPTSARVAGVLRHFARVPATNGNATAISTDVVGAMLAECNAALRDAYGEASLPDDIRPSEI